MVEYQQRFVGFLDVLGFRSHIERTLKDRKFHELLHEKLMIGAQLEGYYEQRAVRRSHGLQFTVFSDSIVISSDDPFNPVMTARNWSHALAGDGIFVRGGFASGLLYHEDQIVYGPGLIKAYELESQVARVPRIVLDDEVVRAMRGLTPREFELLEDSMLLDSDGFHILRPFMPMAPGLLQEKPHIEKGLCDAQERGRPDLISKYRWLALQFNAQIERSGLSEVLAIEVPPSC